MKKIWSGILIGFLSLLIGLDTYLITNDLLEEYLVDTSSSVYNQASVLQVTKTFEEKKIETPVTPVADASVVEVPVVEEVGEPVYEEPVYTEPVYQEEVSYNRIRVAGIDSPLMKDDTGDNFYLNHNINGEYDGLGVPYVDFRTDFTTRKTIIYAHSSTMGNGPFQALQNYHYNQWFFENNRYITIDYNGNHYIYEIFSVYVSVADSDSSEGLEYFYRTSYSDYTWGERIQWYKNNSEYDTGVSVSSSDKILILQTCSMDPNYYEKYYRYNLLVMGKLV